MPETPHGWLDSTLVLSWLKIDGDASDQADLAETIRQAVGSWVEDRRRDLFTTTDEGPVFEATPRVVQAALLAVGRLYGRYDKATFAELGNVDSTIGGDVDLVRLLGKPRPVLG